MEDLVFGRRYRVIEKIGSGGMADVYKAVDEVLGRTVAVKVLHPRYASEPNFVARFRQEAQAAANLSHPGIVNIYDWGRDGETYYIVMEYVNGTDLKTLVTERGPLDPQRAADYAAQVCAALAVAHGYDIIHRDIKPHNIVLTPDGTIKVMDFGIARAGNSTMTQTGSVLGTAQYISPEQAQGRNLGPASDLYSLGVTLYELVTGTLPFNGETPVATALMQVNDQPAPPRQVRPSVPPALEAVIMRSLRKNPAERYTSAAEMRADLKRVVSGEPALGGSYGGAVPDHTSVLPPVERSGATRTAGPRVQPVPQRRVNPWVWVAVGAVALVLLGLGAAWALGAFADKGVAVPTLAGLTQEQAETKLATAGLTLGEVTTENSDSVDVGLIIRQDPEAGKEVEEGAAVNIVVSAGVAETVVPDVTGKLEAEAIDLIEAAELDYDRTVREYNSEVPKGQVVRTDPVAGSPVPKNSKVTLVVSDGVEQLKVPDVTGKPVASAEADLKAAGFEVKKTEEFSDTVAKGNVISQTPDPGVIYEAGSTVTIVVSKGVQVIIVPDVRDQDQLSAENEIRAAGLVPKVVYVDAAPDDEGMVINQSPIPGASAKPGDIVEIEVGKSPEEP